MKALCAFVFSVLSICYVCLAYAKSYCVEINPIYLQYAAANSPSKEADNIFLQKHVDTWMNAQRIAKEKTEKETIYNTIQYDDIYMCISQGNSYIFSYNATAKIVDGICK